jgi:hypothetical protein
MEVSQAEFARIVGVSKPYITKLVKSGKLKLNANGKLNLEESQKILNTSKNPSFDANREHAKKQKGVPLKERVEKAQSNENWTVIKDKKKIDKFVDADTEVTVELVEKDGFYELETNIYEILGDYSNGIITSDILGKAFEPEQRFEERDESDIIFNVDFYGNHRGVSTIPGPLAK